MNAPTFVAAANEKSLPTKSGMVQITQTEDDSERTKVSLARLTSNSVDRLGELISEIQEMREFLQSESERVQLEIGNYMQLSQNVATALNKIKADTIVPWKRADGEARRPGLKQLANGRERLKPWPAAPS
jgi:hypothetical protein